MPIEDATVKWPERLSATVPVARLPLPREHFDSEAQLAFADVLRYNPWRSRPERWRSGIHGDADILSRPAQPPPPHLG
jgi:hypothetical protein